MEEGRRMCPGFMRWSSGKWVRYAHVRVRNFRPVLVRRAGIDDVIRRPVTPALAE
jgi:hypothetical protein